MKLGGGYLNDIRVVENVNVIKMKKTSIDEHRAFKKIAYSG